MKIKNLNLLLSALFFVNFVSAMNLGIDVFDGNGYTAAGRAVFEGNLENLNDLLSSGCNIKKGRKKIERDETLCVDDSLLHIAVSSNHPNMSEVGLRTAIVKCLLGAGANPQRLNKAGETALEVLQELHLSPEKIEISMLLGGKKEEFVEAVSFCDLIAKIKAFYSLNKAKHQSPKSSIFLIPID